MRHARSSLPGVGAGDPRVRRAVSRRSELTQWVACVITLALRVLTTAQERPYAPAEGSEHQRRPAARHAG